MRISDWSSDVCSSDLNEIENDNDNKSDIQSNSVQVVPVAIGNAVDAQDFVDFFGTDIVPDTDAVHSANDFEDLAQTLIDTLVSDAVAVGNLLDNDGAGPDGFGAPVAVTQVENDGNINSDASDG